MAYRPGDSDPFDFDDLLSNRGVLLRFTLDTSKADPGIDAAAYIQQTFNLAASLAVGGSRAVIVFSAHFYGSEMITVPNRVSVEATSEGAYDVSGTPMMSVFFVLQTTGTQMKGIRIIGSGQGSQPVNHAGAPSAADVRLSGSGIIFAGVVDGLIQGCRAENCGGTTGVLPYNGVAGIWLTFGCINCIAEGNRIKTSRNGINQDNYFQASPHGNKIINNWVDGCRFGIADDCDANAFDTLISGNSISNCQQSGIDLNKSQKARVLGNFLKACGLQNGNHGIWEYGTASIPAFDNLIEGNHSEYNIGSGIKSGPYVYNTLITGNHCNYNTLRGVHIIGQNRIWTVSLNKCRGNLQDGILIFSLSPDVTTTGELNGNMCWQNGRQGILLDGAAECLVIGNILKDNSQSVTNTYDGLRMTNGTILSQIFGNQISGGMHRYAIAGTDNNTLGNTFIGNSLQAGATGLKAFANLNQNWGDNGDTLKTTAGAPDNTYPYGSKVFNSVDNKHYWRNPSGAWVASPAYA